MSEELLAELQAHPDGADLLITAFYTAAVHYRRSTICTPFPTEVFPPLPDTRDKDFPALHRALYALPPVHTLLAGGEPLLRSLPPACAALLSWLLLNPARRRRFSLLSLSDLLRQLRARLGGAWQLPALARHNSPTFVLRAHEGHMAEPFPHGAIAYHGTHLENLHSIVHTGLQNLSGTRLQRTGANFGAGIYLSTNYETAFSFCQPCDSWPHSRYGTRLRVLLVCEVDLDRTTQETDRAVASGGSAPAASSSGPALPDTYLLVQRADAIRLLFVLVFCDARGSGGGQGASGLPGTGGTGARRRRRIDWCTVIVLLYAGFLLGKALLSALRQYRY